MPEQKPQIDWEDLKYFLTVARHGSFKAAAAALRTSHPTVGRRIAGLEEVLGVRLFRRQARGTEVTASGKRLLAMVELVDQQVGLIGLLSRSELAPEGVIRLWTTDGIGGYWLPAHLDTFRSQYPNITIETVCTSDPPTFSDLGSDILIVYDEPEEAEMVVLCRGRMAFQPFASKAYIDGHGAPRSLTELSRHLICEHTEYPDDGAWRRWREATRDARVTFRTNSSMGLGEVTRRGMGISLQPVGVKNEREPDLVMLDIEGFVQPELVFMLVSHRQTKDIPRVRAFIRHLQATLFEGSRKARR